MKYKLFRFFSHTTLGGMLIAIPAAIFLAVMLLIFLTSNVGGE